MPSAARDNDGRGPGLAFVAGEAYAPLQLLLALFSVSAHVNALPWFPAGGGGGGTRWRLSELASLQCAHLKYGHSSNEIPCFARELPGSTSSSAAR